ncbi:TonB-dependent receptor plug domain-containing protein [Leptospira santarosai]|uniref:TonB-dependent receptor n=2 Tax=Leptospira santarosai TaxID=28183 RepID=A0AB73MKZ8_9LEPT|nr:TonB-dependent receptor plug domain-containing protein [Leptospira santarosai]AVV52112.1 TonB-dependent receptor [Leptospira santarosai]MDI7166669.1 TonB-dependent receptor plug domain-containing protein [Leptospira santarosai]MDI7173249.1 TonB-dependent receptor plug domain-containing protein [Leptospira santarosai]MDI7192773.1 TonB-dependent receptor plug domain-containing protein [Leptospira santarosai]MDO6393779.1 TonB-dependent receptor plug domain-containing protein [Leptospira santar
MKIIKTILVILRAVLVERSVMLRKRTSFLFLIFFAVPTMEVFAEVTFRARVYSHSKNSGEANVRIMLFETQKFYQADAEGYFQGVAPSSGVYRFRFLKDTGFQEIRKEIGEGKELIVLDFDQSSKSSAGGSKDGDINVTGEREKQLMSRTKLRFEEIKRMPGTFGEPLRSIETIPGVVPVSAFGGGASNFSFRGADPTTNLYLYDDLPILYPFHFDGLTATINGNLIKSMDVYTGVLPANFNNALGGVIEIESPDKVERSSGNFLSSLWAASANYQTTFANGKGYIMGAVKVGYMDKTFETFGTITGVSSLPDGVRLPRYTDSQVKMVYNFNDKHQISFYSLTAKDDTAFNPPVKRHNDPTKDQFAEYSGGNLSVGQGYRTQALRYIWRPVEKFVNRITLISYDPFVDYNVLFGSLKAKQRASGAYTGIRQDAYWDPNKHLTLEFGSEMRFLNYNTTGNTIQQTDPNNPDPNPYDTVTPDFKTVSDNNKVKSKYYNAYTTMKIKFGGLLIEPGARYDYIPYIKNGALGPKTQVSYKFEEGPLKGTTVFGGAGNHFNFPLDTRFSEQNGNPHLKFQKSFKYGGGVDHQLNSNWQVKGEVFKQEFSNLIGTDPYITEIIGTNPDQYGKVFQPYVLNKPLNYSNNGVGHSRGYELLIRKVATPGKRDWFGWISYTWSQTFRNPNIYKPDGIVAPVATGPEQRLLAQSYHNSKQTLYDYDRTHIINLVFGWKFSQNWQFGARWSYLTSMPITPIVGDDGGRFSNPANRQTIWAPVSANNPYLADYINTKRLNDYHRLDIRIDKFLNYEWGYVNTFFEIINVYMRQNVAGEAFNVTRPYSSTNPKPSPTFGTISLPGGVVIPFFNIGIEVKF